jgi:hypothetical protein
MEIPLSLEKHCIETASKREYEQLLRQCFKISDTDAEINLLENRVSALKYLLENADFSDLRKKCDKVVSTDKNAVLIIPQHFKDIHVRIDTATLYPEWKNK